MSTSEGPETTFQELGKVHTTTEGPMHTHSTEEGVYLNVWVGGCWRAGLEAGPVLVTREKS